MQLVVPLHALPDCPYLICHLTWPLLTPSKDKTANDFAHLTPLPQRLELHAGKEHFLLVLLPLQAAGDNSFGTVVLLNTAACMVALL